MPAVLFFTTITLVVTLVQLSRFHLDSLFGIAWLVVYAVFPVTMTMTLVDQVRRAPASPLRRAELPGLTPGSPASSGDRDGGVRHRAAHRL